MLNKGDEAGDVVLGRGRRMDVDLFWSQSVSQPYQTRAGPNRSTNLALGKQQLHVALGNSAVLLLVVVTDIVERGGGGG